MSNSSERLCPMCGKPIPPRRREWCSDACGRKFHSSKERVQYQPHPYMLKRMRATRKRRACLGCGKTFMSEGNWNRFCPRCAAREDGSGRVVEAKARYDWQERF